MFSQLGRRGILRGMMVGGIFLLVVGMLATKYSELHTGEPLKFSGTHVLNTLVKTMPSQVNSEEKSGYHNPLLSPKIKGITQVDVKYPMDLDGTREEAVNPNLELLEPDLVPPNVHMIWCGEKRWFEFKHYLTVQSVLRQVKPDKIVFHYEQLPTTDNMFYNLWLEDIKHDYPSFMMQKMNEHQLSWCHADEETRIGIIMEMLLENGEGGIFVGENTWMVNFKALDRRTDLSLAMEPGNTEGYLILRNNVVNQNVTYQMVLENNKYRTKKVSCSKIHHIYEESIKDINPTCMIVKGGRFTYFTPMDIWELQDPFGRLARKLFYGTEEIRHPEPSYDELVPNIGHMVWIGGGPMDFMFYLSLLSMLYVVKVDTVYIHGDMEPASDSGYWTKVKTSSELSARVKYIYRTPPYEIYQGTIEPWYRALMSDLIRVDLMIKYGGVYTDTDAIWVKGLTHEDRGYDAVASYDWVDWSWPFPDSVNFGLSYGKRNAPFWQIFRDSMRTLHNDVHGFTGVMMPYKLLEKYPHLLKIDRHLQVICYQQRCHPIWVQDYHNMTKDHITMNSIPNWREDVNAFHWTHPNPPELADEEAIRKSTGIFAEIGKFVLTQAGLWHD